MEPNQILPPTALRALLQQLKLKAFDASLKTVWMKTYELVNVSVCILHTKTHPLSTVYRPFPMLTVDLFKQ